MAPNQTKSKEILGNQAWQIDARVIHSSSYAKAIRLWWEVLLRDGAARCRGNQLGELPQARPHLKRAAARKKRR